ncbi:MAG: hypothetical protein KF901_03985 [Myxococcales bacterium]|nr:hypothetical protein [Myxococcales bacterium]
MSTPIFRRRPPKRAARPGRFALRLIGLSLLGLLAPGIDCQSRPGCDHADACRARESRRCINFCAPRWTDAEVITTDGAACPRAEHECSLELDFSRGDLALCPTGWSCAADPQDPASPRGRCEPAGRFGAHCGRFANDAAESGEGFGGCSPGLACVAESCATMAPWERFMPNLPPPGAGDPGSLGDPGRCLPHALEGQRCDTDVLTAPGCATCEPGTLCLDARAYGLEGLRCLRPCDSDGDCACGAKTYCDAIPDSAIAAHGGAIDGRTFCRPCLATHATCERGNPALTCCDGSASCERVYLDLSEATTSSTSSSGPHIDFGSPVWRGGAGGGTGGSATGIGGFVGGGGTGSSPSGGTASGGPSFSDEVPSGVVDVVDRCCRREGTACEQGLEDACCSGTRCGVRGTCETCGITGMNAKHFACCPGYVAVPVPSGGRECRRCGALGTAGACSPYTFVTMGRSAIDNVAIPATNAGVPDVLGLAGGNLVDTRGRVEAVSYRLHPRHRAYAFYAPFTRDHLGGLSGGDSYRALPPTQDAVSEVLHRFAAPQSIQAVRVYDPGACSLMLDWQRLVDNVTIDSLRSNLYPPRSAGQRINAIRHIDTQVSPVLRHRPAFPAELPLGPAVPDDRLHIQSKFRFEHNSCIRAIEVTIDLELAIELTDLQPPDRGLDAHITSAGCEWFSEATGNFYECDLPVERDGEQVRLERFVIRETPRCAPGACFEEELVLGVGCMPWEDEYRCTLPVLEARPRGDYRVVNVDRRNPNSELVDWQTFARPRFPDPFRRRIRVRPTRTDIRFDRHCALSAVTAPLIRRKLWAGISAGFGDIESRLTSVVANAFRMAPRRVLIRPEGVEIVLAENERDPQYARALEQTTATDRSVLWRLASCEDARNRTRGPAGEVGAPNPSALPVVSSSSGSAVSPRLRDQALCRPDAPDACGDVCPETGYRCTDGVQAFLTTGEPMAAAFRREAVCAGGACCNPEDLCTDGDRTRCRGRAVVDYSRGEFIVRCGADCRAYGSNTSSDATCWAGGRFVCVGEEVTVPNLRGEPRRVVHCAEGCTPCPVETSACDATGRCVAREGAP